MTTVKEFKDLGVEFVDGDMFSDANGNKDCCVAYSINRGSTFWCDDAVIYFDWRPLNTLPTKQKFKYEVDFGTNSWRPLLDQSQTETKEEKEVFYKMKPYELDEHVSSEKPAFTQAMTDVNELPPVGSTVIFDADGNSDYLNEYELGLSDGDEVEIIAHFYAGELMVAAFTYSISHGKLVSQSEASGFKPIDNRTPKQKSVDAVMEEWPIADKSTLEIAYDLWNK